MYKPVHRQAARDAAGGAALQRAWILSRLRCRMASQSSAEGAIAATFQLPSSRAIGMK
jgi:hypothetical protein